MQRFAYEYLVIPIAIMLLTGSYWLDLSRSEAAHTILMQEEALLLEQRHQSLRDSLERPMLQMQALGNTLYRLASKGRWQEVENALYLLASTNPDYLQLRYIDQQGLERVRINHYSIGEPALVPVSQLQPKHDRPYTQRMLKLPAGHFYLSRLDLNVEQGSIQIPLQPTLRIGMRLADQSAQGSGFLIINLNARKLLHELRGDHDVHLFNTYMLNSDADWLSAPEEDLAWRTQLGHGHGLYTYPDAPDVKLDAITQSTEARGKQAGHWLITPVSIDFDFAFPVHKDEKWFLASHLNNEGMTSLLPDKGTFRAMILSAPLGALVLFFALRSMRRSREVAELARLEVRESHEQSEILEHNVQRRTRQLREALAFIETLTDHLPVLIAAWGRDFRCQFINSTCADWFELSKAEALNMTLAECMGEERFESRRALLDKVLQGESASLETLYPHPNGGVRLLLVRYLPLSGGERGFIMIVEDITDQRQADQVLRDRTHEAEQAAEAKQSFLANMSHEVRTPMNAILGMLQLLLDTGMTEAQRNYAAKAYQASESLLRILNEILDLSKLEAGRVSIEKTPFDLEELVQRSADLFALEAERKGLNLSVEIDPQLPRQLLGDSLRLGQILSNLMGNAIKFTHQGEICLSMELLSEHESSAQLAISIADTGVGMTDEQLQRIFQAFNQGEDSTARRYGGTGLGLAISRALAEAMGGELSVDSHPGMGSVFTLKIALEVPEQSRRYADLRLPELSVYLPHAGNTASIESLHQLLVYWDVEALPYPADWQDALGRADRQHALILLGDKQLDSAPVQAALSAAEMNPGIAARLRLIVLLPPGHVIPCGRDVKGVSVYCLPGPQTPARLFAALSGEFSQPESLSIQPEPEPVTKGLQTFSSLHLLVVDDLAVNREVVVHLLHKLGVTCDEAESGEQAIERVTQGRYDAILMDVYMDGMTGYEATRALPDGAPPVIGLSASVLERDQEAAREAGMVDYLGKPVVLEDLHDALSRLFGAEACESAEALHEKAPENASLSVSVSTNGVTDWKDNLPEFIDRDRVQHQFGDDEEIYMACLASFASSLDELAATLEQAITTDSDTLAGVAHRIKGGAGTVANRELEQRSQAVEAELRTSGDAEAARSLLQLLKQQREQLAELDLAEYTL
ncbi:ATP-binding protein [Marinobacterium stanieri]|uniref:Sensory/regulatory protein RpfC n=1 Tax=Marinobacterium stanieri TaxID=49186 RepID=A0A1N6QAC8_9GAMM|nr:ATP-binding protein [Marinobacterium stanieri]SIQ13509.1 PAS domain S-box-containing protein [Marinobacterium stanieri]